MHREFEPQELQQLVSDPFAAERPGGEARGPRGLLGIAGFLGILIILELLSFGAGESGWRLRRWISPALIAGIGGALYVVYRALASLRKGKLGADVALAQASLAALVIGEPLVAAEVVFIAVLGELLEEFTFARTKRALGRLFEQTPRTARVRRDGQDAEIPVSELRPGDLVIVGPGERIPADGPILAGRSTVDESALTGESLPVDKGPGDPVFTGTLNQFGVIELRADRVGGDTTFGQVARMVSQARLRKADLERLADRLARYFLPAVQVAAGSTLLVGYLLGWPDVWTRTVAVLVVACPCPLVLATPATMLASMAWLARNGILIKGGYALERLAACDVFAFDKTGTLTLGRPQWSRIITAPGHDESEVLQLAASAEQSNPHPLARALLAESSNRRLAPWRAIGIAALPGAGVEAELEPAPGRSIRVLVGNARLLRERGCRLDDRVEDWLKTLDEAGETPLLVAADGAVVGVIGLHDQIRPEAHDVIHDLKDLKVAVVALLTGDREPAARRIARRAHIGVVAAELLPLDKAEWIRGQQAAGRRVAMIGDGINDAPALAQADAGIALGRIGADLAAEAGDLIILGDSLRRLPQLLLLARAAVRIIRQNIIGFAFGLNGVAVFLAAMGILSPLAAAVLHQAGSLLVLLNAMRLLIHGGWGELAPVRAVQRLWESVERLDESLAPELLWTWLARRIRPILALAAASSVALYLASGWTTIGPGELGVVQRWGGFQRLLDPGLHPCWPPPIERVTRLPAGRLQSLEIGFRSRSWARPEPWLEEDASAPGTEDRTEPIGDPLVLTGDDQYLDLAASVLYAVDSRSAGSVVRAAFGMDDPREALQLLAESTIRQVVAQRRLLELLSQERSEAEREVTEQLRARVAALDMGIEIRAVVLLDVRPPAVVIDAYRDVTRAESELQRRVNEAEQFRAEALSEAKAKAESVAQEAAARGFRLLTAAGGEAAAFRERLAARRSDPELADLRTFWETLERSLSGRSKLILETNLGLPQRLVLADPGVELFPSLRPASPTDATSPVPTVPAEKGDLAP